MKTLTIAAKGSNTGSIHDIADSNVDRVIAFRGQCRFAVVPASYYGGNAYSTHKSAEAAALTSRRTKESHKVIDDDGIEYQVQSTYDGFDLVSTHQKAA